MRFPARQAFVGALVVALFVTFGTPTHASAQQKEWAVGLGFSSIAAGVSAKHYLSDSFALEGVVGGWQPYGGHPDAAEPGLGDGVAIDLGVLHEMPALAEQKGFVMNWHYGAAGTIGIADDAGSGRIVGGMGNVGLQFALKQFPIEFAVQYRPGLYLYEYGAVDDIELDFIDFGAHLRFRF